MKTKPLKRINLPRKLTAMALAACSVLTCAYSQAATSASSSGSSTSEKHIYVGNYDFSTNPWGWEGTEGSGWYEQIATTTGSTTSMNGAIYKWTNFADTVFSGVKAYPSFRRGIPNSQNVPSSSGFPYLIASNTKNINVSWTFVTAGYTGTGSITGSYNHTLDLFMTKSSTSTSPKNIKGEIMIIPSSSGNSQTDGWGNKYTTTFIDSYGATWDVWYTTQKSEEGGITYSWPVTQYRKRTQSKTLNINVKFFMADAKNRDATMFASSYYVGMVEAGTEIKYGSGRVTTTAYSVSVTGS